jgi:hypothetical protein
VLPNSEGQPGPAGPIAVGTAAIAEISRVLRLGGQLLVRDRGRLSELGRGKAAEMVRRRRDTLIEPKVPRRIDWRVRVPNQVSTWLIQPTRPG